MPRAVELPIPRDWQVFEDFCCQLFAAEWGDREAQKYGRSGQGQHGVDVYGRRDGRWQAVQCKRKQRFPESKLTAAQVRREVTEAYDFSRPLETLVVATTAQPDTAVQDLAAELTDDHGEEDDERKRFRVVVYGWDELCEKLQRHPALYDVWRRELLGPVPERGNISGVLPVPNLPPHYLPRPEDLAPLKAALLEGARSKLGVTGSARQLVGVQGMGGIGKTVLAVAACHDEDVQAAFADGIVWITIGQEPNLLRRQQDFARALGAGDTVLGSVTKGKRVLKGELEARCVLLVLDDVWELEHASALDVGGPSSRLLVTTRNREILVGLGADELQLDVLAPQQSRALLALWARASPGALPAIADEVAGACGHLPLALAMIGAMVRLRPTVWEDALERLRRADLDKIRRQFPDYPYPDLLRALAVSVEALDPRDRDRYVELAVFPEDASMPTAAVEVLWSVAGLDAIDARDLMDRLVARSLARRDEEGRVSLHDLQGDYVRHKAGDLRQLHERLLDGYRSRSPKGLVRGEPDGYFHDHVAAHLARTERLAELRELLSDYRWLEAKLRVSDLQALLTDYQELEASDPLRRVAGALRLSAHVLVKAPNELPSQLVGRLLDDQRHETIARLWGGARLLGALRDWFEPLRRAGHALRLAVHNLVKAPEQQPSQLVGRLLEVERHEAIARLLDGARRQGASQGWLRPLRCSLERPGGALMQTLEGHTDWVEGVAGLPDGRVVSASDDRTLRVWDPDTGETLQTLEGHTDRVTGVAGLPDGRVVSASDDRTLRVWDPDTGETLQILEGHGNTDRAAGVIALADGRVVSTSDGRTLRVWDPNTGDRLQAPRGHWRRHAAALADGRVVSVSFDGTLRVWDPDTGETLQTLEGDRGISGLAALADGRVVSASSDYKPRVWDMQTGETLQTLVGHTEGVKGVAALPDGRVVSASDDRTLRVWDSQTGQTLQILEGHTAGVWDVVALADGRVVSASLDHTLRVWNPQTGQTPQDLESHKEALNGVAALADGRVVSASSDGTLRVWDPRTGQTLRTLEGHTKRVSGVAALANGRVVSASEDGTLRVWRPKTGQTLRIYLGHSHWVRCVTALADGRVVSASIDGALRVWNPKTGQTLQTLVGHTDDVIGVAALPDGRVVSASDDRTLRVWNPKTGQMLESFEVHTGWVTSVAGLTDGRVVSASADDCTLRVWDPKTGQTHESFEGHTDQVWAMAALANGRVVSASKDCTLRVWDLQTGKTLATFHADADLICVAACRGSGNLVAGDSRGRLHWLQFEEAAS